MSRYPFNQDPQWEDLGNGQVGQRVKIMGRKQKTTQTHTVVSVTNGSWVPATDWLDCEGYSEIAYTLMNDANTNSGLALIWSNDGVTAHGQEQVLSSGSSGAGYGISGYGRTGNTTVKARYVKVSIANYDAATHVMSAWALLKS